MQCWIMNVDIFSLTLPDACTVQNCRVVRGWGGSDFPSAFKSLPRTSNRRSDHGHVEPTQLGLCAINYDTPAGEQHLHLLQREEQARVAAPLQALRCAGRDLRWQKEVSGGGKW
jgi:hypothetical protein